MDKSINIPETYRDAFLRFKNHIEQNVMSFSDFAQLEVDHKYLLCAEYFGYPSKMVDNPDEMIIEIFRLTDEALKTIRNPDWKDPLNCPSLDDVMIFFYGDY